MSAPTVKTYSFEEGKYEIDREIESPGMIVAVRRNGEPWTIMLNQIQFQKMVYAMLNHIDTLEAK